MDTDLAFGVAPRYVLGSSEAERRRLSVQAGIIQPVTERIFRAARISKGMRVLDLGSGVGDVSFLVARMVGPAGEVVGIERDWQSVAAASERARAGRIRTVQFLHESIESASFSRPFDAVVGRLVLLFQPDPAATLRHAASFVRRRGTVAIHEFDVTLAGTSWPIAPLFQLTVERLRETFRRGGASVDMGMRLHRTFLDAGLPGPKILAEAIMGAGPGSAVYGWLASTLVNLLPEAELLGVTTAAEVQPPTLAQRLEQEVVEVGAQIMSPLQVGAWSSKL
jgi:SAM-dependent methyltransferase